jgi:DNA-binding transcriptional regulator YdaS (Cro superfamily)
MMDLDTYLSTIETAVSLASRLGVTPGFVSQWRTGVRPVPITHCVAIEKATQGMVTRKDLRPDDWHLIWPELSDLPPPPRDASAYME